VTRSKVNAFPVHFLHSVVELLQWKNNILGIKNKQHNEWDEGEAGTSATAETLAHETAPPTPEQPSCSELGSPGEGEEDGERAAAGTISKKLPATKVLPRAALLLLSIIFVIILAVKGTKKGKF
jgi:hypothetical protein